MKFEYLVKHVDIVHQSDTPEMVFLYSGGEVPVIIPANVLHGISAEIERVIKNRSNRWLCDDDGDDHPSLYIAAQASFAVPDTNLWATMREQNSTSVGVGDFDVDKFYAKLFEALKARLHDLGIVVGKEHPDTADTAASYNNIASVYRSQGKYPEALEWDLKALAIYEKLGEEHASTAATYGNIAVVYYKLGKYPEALEWLQKALPICETVLGEEHPFTALTYGNIGEAYYGQGKCLEALEWYQKALAIFEKVPGKERLLTGSTYNKIGLLCTEKNYEPHN